MDILLNVFSVSIETIEYIEGWKNKRNIQNHVSPSIWWCNY